MAPNYFRATAAAMATLLVLAGCVVIGLVALAVFDKRLEAEQQAGTPDHGPDHGPGSLTESETEVAAGAA